jgi:Na+/melibiose symporter-like transporter
LGGALVFALAQLPTSALALALLVYLPPHLTRDLGVPLAVVGACWATVRILDVMVDPFLGLIMDRTRTPLGRYRPWLLLGAPILVAGVAALFLAPVGIGRAYLIGWLLVLYLSISILTLALPAWGATLATSYNDRARIYGALAAVGIASSIGILLLPVVGGALHKTDAWSVHAMGWFLIVLTPVLVGLSVWRTRETVSRAVADHDGVRVSDYVALVTKPDLVRVYLAQVCLTLGPGWMSSLYLFFSRDVMQFGGGSPSILLLVYIAGGLAGAPLMAHLATRIGKHRTLMVAAAAYSIGLCTVLLPPKGMWWFAIPINLWCGFMGASFEMTVRSMLADVADEVRLDQGRERLSLVFAINSGVTKLSTAFAIGITYPLLAAAGYVASKGVHNTSGALRGLALLFIAGPIGFVMLGAACMIGWRMTASRHAEVRAALDARDSLAALGDDDARHLDDLTTAAELGG